MNKELQRIKIAEACGWTSCQIIQGDPMGRPVNVTDQFRIVPNYPEDLNAMHEAEKVLLGMCDNDPQADLWISYLANLVLAAPCCLREHATAAQRADAFCETLNLREE